MTGKEVYDAIVSLTSEIKATNVGLNLFDAAKSRKSRKVKKVCNAFIGKYPELYKKMCDFSKSFDDHMVESIARDDKETQVYMYDSNIIDAPSFFALTFFTNINDLYMLPGIVIQLGNNSYIYGDEAYLDVIEKESGSSHLADFLGIASFSNDELTHLKKCGYEGTSLYNLLVDAYTGFIKEFYRQ